MKRTLLIVLMIAVVGAAAGGTWWWTGHRHAGKNELVLYGNVDLRQVMLAFNNNERISEELVQEGDRVYKGQVLARLDTSRLEPQVAQAKAVAEAQKHVVDRMHNGSRPEEIAQGRANLESSKADAANARRHYERFSKLVGSGAVSKEDLDNAKAAMDVAEAKVAVSQKALDLLVIGPRKEDIAQAEAQLRANEAQLAFLRRQLADAELLAPSQAVIRTRLLEPGEMASPQKPVFSLAITDPKWVRAYVSEPDLGKVQPGTTASEMVDSFPDQRFEGW